MKFAGFWRLVVAIRAPLWANFEIFWHVLRDFVYL
jgi:hypothetical protein